MNHAGGGGSINRSTEPAESICLLQLSRKCPSRAATPMDTVLQNHGSAQSGSALCKAQPGKAIEGRARSPFSASSPSESQSHLHIHSCSCGDRKSDRLSLGKMVALMSSSATVLKTFAQSYPSLCSFLLYHSRVLTPAFRAGWIRTVSLASSLFG